MIKQVFLSGMLLSSLASVGTGTMVKSLQANSIGDFTVTYPEQFGSYIDGTTKTYNWGQKFVIAVSDTEAESLDYGSEFRVLKTTAGLPYAVINSAEDFKLIEQAVLGSNWQTDTFQSYSLLAIGDYKLSDTTTFSQTMELTDYLYGIDTDREAQTCDDILIRTAYQKAGGNSISFGVTFEAINQDTTRPVIDGYEGVYVTSVDNPVSVETVKAQLTAHDEVDGPLTDQIKIDQDNYTGHEHEVGEYDVIFSVSDKAGNKATLTIKISVVDGASPVFSGPSSITSNLSSSLDLEAIKAQISVTDNYDKDIQYTIETDEFTGHENEPGTYKIVFKAVDSSTNVTTKTVTITVKDDVKPTISGSATYKSGYDQKIEIETIKQSLVASDNVDTIDKSSIQVIEDGYSDNYNRPGTYKVKFQVSDKSGNQSEVFEVTINVVDEKLPVFEVSNFIINLDYYSSLSHEQIVELLASTGQIEMDRISNVAEQVTFVTDEYAGTDKPGTYLMRVNVKYDDGEEKNIEFKLNKLAEQVTEPDVDLPWYQDVWNWCVNNIFEPIGNFFKSAWDWIVGLFK